MALREEILFRMALREEIIFRMALREEIFSRMALMGDVLEDSLDGRLSSKWPCGRCSSESL